MAKVNTYDRDEDMEVTLNNGHIKKAGRYLAPYKKEFLITLLVVLMATIANMGIPFITQIALDDKIPAGDVKGLAALGVLCLIIWAICVVSNSIQRKYMSHVGNSIIHDIRRDLFEHMQKLPFTYYDSRPHGKILVRVVNYVNSLADMFSNGIISAIMEIVSMIIVLVYMLTIDVQLTLLSLLGLPVFGMVIVKLKTAHRKAWQQYSNKNSNLNAYLHESINGIRITQAFVREKRNSRIFFNLCSRSFRAWMKAKKIEGLIYPSSKIISQFMICLMYFIGILYISGQKVGIGVIVAMVAYIERFWNPIINISNLYNSIITNAAYLDRIFEMMEEDTVIKDAKDAKELGAVSGAVTFDNITFSYDGESNILERLSFKVKPGETIALVGQTGAGKTTVVNLLSRYYNINEGRILLDDTDISRVTVKSLRNQLGYMLQDSFVFTGTIKENIRYGRLDASDEEVEGAAKAVNAHEFIMNLPDGYNTPVSERGTTLSAGQRQLISLARAMLKNPKILILDEATSSIDTETEVKLMQGIEEILKGRTAFVIAHRLSTIRSADRIMVIGNKGIIEQGSHAELLEIGGEYAKLYHMQMAQI